MRLSNLEDNRVEGTSGLARERPAKVEGASSAAHRTARAGRWRAEGKGTHS